METEKEKNDRKYIFDDGMIEYGNELNELDLSGLSLEDQRIFMAILYVCRNRNPHQELILTKKELLNLGIYPDSTKIPYERIRKNVLSFARKFSRIVLTNTIDNEKEFSIDAGCIFTRVYPYYDKENGEITLTVKLNEWAVPYLEKVFSNYTRFSLMEFQSLTSTHSQNLYRHLKQFRSTGVWNVSKEKFFEELFLPKSYEKESHLNQRVLYPAVDELKAFFEGLDFTKNTIPTKNGRTKVVGYKFTWKPNREEWNPRKYVPYPDDHPLKYLSSFPTLAQVQDFVEGDHFFPLPAEEAYNRMLEQAKKGTKIRSWKGYLRKMKENYLEEHPDVKQKLIQKEIERVNSGLKKK